jgi:ATP-dependent HslUV protease ATP-binding subunit HslU
MSMPKLLIKEKELTPREIVTELDRYVVGQDDAKRSVSIALRNRWRRKHVEKDLQEEIYPHNILMVGPTGVGKTEIPRRLSKLVKAPFIKVEATKFTEIGYVGRDVDSIIRDLVDISVSRMRKVMHEDIEEKASALAEARIINCLVGENSSEETKAKFYEKFKQGILDDKEIEIQVADNPAKNHGFPMFDIPGASGGQMGVVNVGDMLAKALGGNKTKLVKMTVREAHSIVLKEESDKLLDEEKLVRLSIKSAEEDGIVFIDEIDKICSKNEGRGEVSREGVQRDLLPLLEGSTVVTKYGPVKTDHILFITAGAFHLSKPSDLLPELQGRLPIRVELNPLREEDLERILKEPKHSLLKQYIALFKVEDIDIRFEDDGIKAIARIAEEINRQVENIGARRLHTILEKLLEGLNFTASETPGIEIIIDKSYVEKNLSSITKSIDLNKFIL